MLITDSNWTVLKQEYGVLPRFIRYGSKEALKQGLIPIETYPDKLIPESEWKERIAEAHQKRMMPIHHFEDVGVKGKNQGGTNYCWAYGIASALEACRLQEAQPYRRLAPATLGWLVNWRNVGYYLADTIRGAHERGIASSEYAPDGTTNSKTFKDGWEQNGLRHRPLEWFDTGGRGERDEREASMVKYCVSLLLMGLPGYIAYNWWGHALMMAGIEWAEGQLYNLKWIAWNSHGDGRIELTGSRGVPDEAYFPGTSIHAP